MQKRKSFWLTVGLANLSLVALLGLTLRTKILFPLPFIDFRSVESAHSHFAFAGWAGLVLITLFIYDVLPETQSQKKIYQWILGGIEVSSLGMALLFPFFGYSILTISFSTLFVVMACIFVPIFIKDIFHAHTDKNIQLLSVVALSSLILSFSGTLGLIYIIVSGSGGSLLYRDSIYTFLHFQYNGFFTVSIFALLFNFLKKKGILLNKYAWRSSIFLSLSIIPSLFLSLLWHNHTLFYLLAGIGCLCILAALYYFIPLFKASYSHQLFSYRMARLFCFFSLVSFVLKMLLQVGTLFPGLANEIYGDRPVIIGFLHLVFLGFFSFFILALLIEGNYFTSKRKVIVFPFIVFAIGIFANELLLMIQGFSILLKVNNEIYKWLLWAAAIILFMGALSIIATRCYVIFSEKKAIRKDGL